MKLTDIPGLRALTPIDWTVAAVVLLAVVAGGWWLITSNSRHKAEATAAKAGAAIAEGRTVSAGEAVKAVDDNAARNTQIDQAVKEAEDDIRNAPEDQRGAAALRALCLRDAYRGDPACERLLQPGP